MCKLYHIIKINFTFNILLYPLLETNLKKTKLENNQNNYEGV